jgi:Ca2+-binding EF-hand superfamily protein
LNFYPTERELMAFTKEFDATGTGISKETLYRIVDKKMHDTDTIEELVEALMCFDSDHE